jgi:hypothetical protein
MIPVAPVARPRSFVKQCQRPGQQWRKKHPNAERPRDYWSQFRKHLSKGFSDRCGYTAMYIPVGTVDHYLSCKNYPSLAYTWENYRYVSHDINARKGNVDQTVLDPYEVKAGWFEILLPSLQLVVLHSVPQKWRGRARYTLERLQLGHHETIIRQRRDWYALYQQEELTLDGLQKKAPLIAEAVKRQPARYLRGEISRAQLKRLAPTLEPTTPKRPRTPRP